MKKTLFLLFLSSAVYGQSIDSIGIQMQMLQEIIVVGVEDETWDLEGAATTYQVQTSPDVDIRDSDGYFENENYLAVELDAPHPRRRALRLSEPVKVPGITKTVSVWFTTGQPDLFGIRLILSDQTGLEYKLWFAKYCAVDWRLYTLPIPPSIVQSSWRVPREDEGIYIHGVEIVMLREAKVTEPISFGLDALTATVDLYGVVYREVDIIRSDW